VADSAVLAFAVFPRLAWLGLRQLCGGIFSRCKAGDKQNGRKKTGNLFLDFLFRIFASNGGYPVVVFPKIM
jgi:hypothetical protein